MVAGARAGADRGRRRPGFVREVCGLWELAGLAEPAALVANELVANAVVLRLVRFWSCRWSGTTPPARAASTTRTRTCAGAGGQGRDGRGFGPADR